jgi:hypothetical protein
VCKQHGEDLLLERPIYTAKEQQKLLLSNLIGVDMLLGVNFWKKPRLDDVLQQKQKRMLVLQRQRQRFSLLGVAFLPSAKLLCFEDKQNVSKHYNKKETLLLLSVLRWLPRWQQLKPGQQQQRLMPLPRLLESLLWSLKSKN